MLGREENRGENAKVKPQQRDDDDEDDGRRSQVGRADGLSLLDGLVRCPTVVRHAHEFCLLSYTDLVSVKKTVCRAIRG